MRKHREQNEDELYLGNFTKENLHSIGWKTVRTGTIPEDINGDAIPTPTEQYFKPVFVKRNEIQLAYENETDKNRKEVYKKMLEEK